MLEISSKTNLLEQKSYKYSLQDVAEPICSGMYFLMVKCRRCPLITAVCL